MPEPEYIKKLIKVDFTQDELLELGMKLTDLIRLVKLCESQKTAAAADFTNRIKQTNLLIDEAMQKIDDGWEMRHEQCLVEYDHTHNIVYYIFEHNGQRIIVEQRKMTADEKQIGLDLDSLDAAIKDIDGLKNSQDQVLEGNIFDALEVPEV
jgi:hypothetical protein